MVPSSFNSSFEASLNSIVTDFDVILECGYISTSEFIKTYTKVFDFCTGSFLNIEADSCSEDHPIRKPYVGIKVGNILFTRIKEHINCWLTNLNENFGFMVGDPKLVIENYLNKWNHFNKCITIISQISSYLSKTSALGGWPLTYDCYGTLYSNLTYLWCHRIYRPRSVELLEIIFSWLNRLRVENQPSTPLIDDFLLSICKLCNGDIKNGVHASDEEECYYDVENDQRLILKYDFLEPYIKRTKEYYHVVAAEFFSQEYPNIMQYIVMVKEASKKETDLIKSCLNESSRRIMMKCIEDSLIDPYRCQICVEMYKMLYNNCYKSSSLLLCFLFGYPNNSNNIELKFETCVQGYSDYTLSCNSSTVLSEKNASEFLRDVYTKFKVLICQHLPSLTGLMPILILIISKMCNSKLDFTSRIDMPKAIAKCIHKNIIALSIDENNKIAYDTLADAVLFMCLIKNRNTFYKFYAEYFEIRFFQREVFSCKIEEKVIQDIKNVIKNPKVLFDTSDSNETFLISEGLKDEEFFCYVPWLSNSVQLSIIELFTLNTIKNFIDYAIQVNYSTPNYMHEYLNVYIYEQTKWYPFESHDNKLKRMHEHPILPAALSHLIDYNEVYKLENKDKRLHILFDNSTVDIVYKNSMGAFNLELSLYQAIIFINLLEERSHKLSYYDLQKTSIMNLYLCQSVYQLHRENLIVIIRDGESIEPVKYQSFYSSDIVQLNKYFCTDKEKVCPSRKFSEKVEYVEEATIDCRKEQYYILQCAAVKLLKHHNKIKECEMFKRLQEAVQKKFFLDGELMMECLKELQSKEYVSFNPKDKTYCYIP